MATTDLTHHIQSIRLVDTHEHMKRETEWVENGPDILQDLFGNYVPADLVTAGASPEAMSNLMDASQDVASRFEGIRDAWEATQFTGYGEAVSLIAKHIYGLDELTGEGLAGADTLETLRKPGKRYHILHDLANLDHIQTDDFSWQCTPDTSGPDFFLYDLSWATFCNGQVDPSAIHAETGVEVKDLASLKQSMDALFAKHAPCAIAVKSQHAYNRTLDWSKRSDADAAAALNAVLTHPLQSLMKRRGCVSAIGAGHAGLNSRLNTTSPSKSTPVTMQATTGCRCAVSPPGICVPCFQSILMRSLC